MSTSTIVLGSALILVVLLGVLGIGVWGLRTLEGLQEGLKRTLVSLEAPKPASNELEGSVLARITALEVGFSGLRSAVEEETKRATNAWGRARAAQSILKRKEELENGEDEPEAGQQLSLADGGLSPSERVPPVHPGVAGAPESDEPEYVRLARAVGYPQV